MLALACDTIVFRTHGAKLQRSKNGSIVLQEGFSLRDALHFYAAAIRNYCIASWGIYSLPTVVAQYLPLALVAQQMMRLMG